MTRWVLPPPSRFSALVGKSRVESESGWSSSWKRSRALKRAGLSFEAGLWGLKRRLRSYDWKIPKKKKEGLEPEDCTWEWKLCPPQTVFQDFLKYWAFKQKESSHRLELLNEGPWNGSTSYSLRKIDMVHQLPRFVARIREIVFKYNRPFRFLRH